MRYEDASHTGAFQGQGPIANDDSDQLAAGSKSSATGNLITGEGTQTGSAGADSATGGHITEIAGKGGEDSSFAGGKLSVMGEYGKLSVDAEGNYVYQANKGVENVRDRFTYTLADNNGATDTAALIVEIGKTPFAVKAGAQQMVVGPDGVVTLPAGVELSDVHVVGRNLVVDMPDGTQLIILDGAVFVPQLVLNGVEVPASNVAALLIGQEVQPAAGETPPSSGGNFAVPPPPLDPGVPLGDLIPPTDYTYTPPEPKEVIPDENDEEPEAGFASALLDDDAQAGGNPLSNVGDDPGGNVAIGSLPGSGGDGSLSWGLLASGTLPTGFSFAPQPNGDIWIMQGATHVLTVVVDPANGNFTVSQVVAIGHPPLGDENNLNFGIEYSVTDKDGDVAIGTLTINVDDDMPLVGVQAGPDANVILTTDDAETIGVASDSAVTTADFSGVFSGTTVVFGADGAGLGTIRNYALAITGSNSGLTSHGAAINLFVVSGVVVGTTAGSAPANLSDSAIVFTVSTTNTGIVTLTQYQQIEHAPENPSGSPFNDQIASLADGLVTLTRFETVVDSDGDVVTGSATVNIGANLQFTDDGPTIDPTLNEVGVAIVDESAPVDANAIPLVGGYTAGDDPDLAGGLAIGNSSTSGPVIDANAAFGADGPAASGSEVYELQVLNSVSGLTTTEGQAINLVKLANGVVVGVVDGTTTAAFAIQIDAMSGVVTVEQYLSLTHPDFPDNYDESNLLNEGSLGVAATAKDFDGDTATSDPVDITPLIRFHDDGPSLSAPGTQPILVVDETLLATNDTQNFASVFGANFGADGPGATPASYALGVVAGPSGLVDSLTGEDVILSLNGGLVEGRTAVGGDLVFTVNVAANGDVTLDQSRAVIHDDVLDPDEATSPATLSADNLITLTATIMDGDGDTATATANIGQNLAFEDDGPSVTIEGAEEPILIVDETTLPANIGPVSFIDSFSIDFGEDGPASSTSTAFSLSITEGPSGLVDTATGNQVFLFLEGGQVVGREGPNALDAVGGSIVFEVSVNAAGAVTLDQLRAVVHGDPTDPDEEATPAMLTADDLIKLNVLASDADGDTASASINIARNLQFQDDGPSIIASGEEPTLIVDETILALDATQNFAGAFIPTFGNDGPGATPVGYALGVAAGPSGLVDAVTGQAVILSLVSGHVEGRTAVSNDLVFTANVAANGDVTLNQLRAVVHNDLADPDEPGASAATLSADTLITLTATVTDADGDTATTAINIGQNLQFEDDGPSITATGTQPILVVDETVLATNATQSFASVFTPSFGNDGAGATPVAYALGVVVGPSGLVDTVTGQSVILSLVSGHVEGRTAVSNDLVFTVNVAANGDLTLDQVRAVVHNDPADPDEPGGSAATLSADNLITLAATVTDKDGDTATATIGIGLNLQFEDDGPSAVSEADSIVGGAGPATGNVITGVEGIFGPDANLTDGVADSVGADTPGTITRIQSSNIIANIDTSYDGANNLVVVGQYGSLTINKDGSYSYTRTDLGAAGVNDVFIYTLSDGDGDTATATLTIGIDDNFPSAGNVNVQRDDDTLAGGNAGGPSDDADATQSSNLLPGSGGDAPLTWGLLLTGAPAGFTYVAGGANQVLVNQGAVTVLTVTITNTATGSYTVVQNAPILHPTQDGTGTDNTENNVQFTINYTVNDADNDTANGTINIDIDDDTPTVTNTGTEPILVVDETILTTNDTQSFAGAFTVSNGADGPAAINPLVYSLGVIAGPSGLVDIATGQNVILSLNGGVVEGHTSVSGELVFTVSVAANGDVTLDQLRAVLHNDPNDPDEPGGSAATLSADNLITLTAAATDKDGDTATARIDIGQNLQFEDDGPTITAASNMNIQNSGDFANTAPFVYNLGADGAPLSNDVIKTVTGSATVNGVAVTGYSISQTSEDATSAIFTFGFDYPVGGGATTHETGTLTFNKGSGTYTVALDHPIAGISVDSVQNGSTPVFLPYPLPPAGPGGDLANGIAVVGLASDLFIQFTGQSDVTTPAADFGLNDLWGGGSQSEVKISSTSIGVFGNSVQDSDVLDYNFYATDPGANLGPPTTSAGVVFIKISQFNGAEDFVVTLKLADPATPGTFIERTFVINADDVLTTAPPGYPPLTNGTGFIIFEPNDYQSLANVPDNYQIVGMQLRSSTEGVQSTVGEVYNFNGALGAADVSPAVFGPPGGGDHGTNDNDVFKIVDIGVVRITTTDQDADLTFNVTLQDGDNDTTSLTLHATVNAAADGSTPIVVPPVALDTNGDGSIAFVDQSAGVRYDYNGDRVAEATAWVGGGDSILVRDANGDGAVTNASEFVFGHDGMTDMQALAAQYGSTLDANDADFGQFKVWNDANGNGAAEAGELQSLSDAGITSIGLVSDGISYSAAGGDVQVAGSSTYTRSDGSTGTVADASFLTGGRVAENQRVLNTSSNNIALAAAVAAAGLADPLAAPAHDNGSQDQQAGDTSSSVSLQVASSVSTDSDSSISTLSNETKEAADDSVPAASLSHSSSTSEESGHSLDNSSAHAGAQSRDAPAANDQAPASSSVEAIPVAPTVNMPSAEALQAVASSNPEKGRSVEQIVAEAMSHVDAPTVDGLLASLPGGSGEHLAIAQWATQDGAVISSWGTVGYEAFAAADMLVTMEVANLHPDAIHPAVNG